MRINVLMLIGLLVARAFAAPADYFAIQVVDDQTGRGVPLVELETTNNAKFLTDSAGFIAFSQPELMNQDVFFTVKSHGYEFEKDGFGFAGKSLKTAPGTSAQLKIKRVNIAERLYRITGGGIYADSVLLGKKAPIKEPLLNAQILGLDSVQPAVYQDQIFWFWGDTNRPKYPLGNFHTTGARSKLPNKGGLDPAVGIDFEYFTNDEGFAKKMMPMPEGTPGPVWTDGVFTIQHEGRERLIGHFTRVKDIATPLERGIMLYNDDKQQFEKIVEVPLDSAVGPWGQAFEKKIKVDGVDYQYFSHWGPPNIRVRADFASVTNLSEYESYTPLATGTKFAGKDTKLDRYDGKLVWAWKKNTAVLSNREQKELIDAGLMKAEESPQFVKNIDDDKPITLHSSTVTFNEYRNKWIMIALEIEGTSKLGEVWYAEADQPEGPWNYAKKIVTHNKYTFYNPRQHGFFSQDNGRYVFFEGTFANSLSGTDTTTPRYEYNQIMYRLDLADPRLKALFDK